MKLLRTTSTDPTGLFNVFLNQDLKLEPFSKIALGQISAALVDDILIVNGLNDVLQFSTKTGAASIRTVRLRHGTYNATNRGTLLEQLAVDIDRALGKFTTAGTKVTIADGNNIGKSCRLTIGKQPADSGKVIIQIHQSKAWSHATGTPIPGAAGPELVKNIFKINGDPQLAITGTTEQAVRLNSVANTVDPSFTRSTFFDANLCAGVGVFRVRLNNLSGSSGAGDLGYTIGLTRQHPSNIIGGDGGKALTLNDLHIGISAMNPYNNGGYGFISSDGTTSTVVPANPAVTPNNTVTGTEKDVVSIEICNGRVRCVIYQHDAGNPNEPFTRVIYDINHDDKIPLFGVIIMHGKSGSVDLKDIKYTGNPYSDTSGPTLSLETDVTYLGKATPGRQITVQTENSLIFNNLSVAQWLGYQNLIYTLRGERATAPNVNFRADDVFKAATENDLYLVEMLNIQLESYDTFEAGRKNILAVVPYDDSGGKVTYDPNNLIFLDLNNKEPINLTSLKFRLVRADYSAPELIGITSAVLFFKGRGE